MLTCKLSTILPLCWIWVPRSKQITLQSSFLPPSNQCSKTVFKRTCLIDRKNVGRRNWMYCAGAIVVWTAILYWNKIIMSFGLILFCTLYWPYSAILFDTFLRKNNFKRYCADKTVNRDAQTKTVNREDATKASTTVARPHCTTSQALDFTMCLPWYKGVVCRGFTRGRCPAAYPTGPRRGGWGYTFPICGVE